MNTTEIRETRQLIQDLQQGDGDAIALLQQAADTARKIDQTIEAMADILRQTKAEVTKPQEAAKAEMEKLREELRGTIRDMLLISGDKRVAGWQLVRDKQPKIHLDPDTYQDLAERLYPYGSVSMVIDTKTLAAIMHVPEVKALLQEYGAVVEYSQHVRLD